MGMWGIGKISRDSVVIKTTVVQLVSVNADICSVAFFVHAQVILLSSLLLILL